MHPQNIQHQALRTQRGHTRTLFYDENKKQLGFRDSKETHAKQQIDILSYARVYGGG